MCSARKLCGGGAERCALALELDHDGRFSHRQQLEQLYRSPTILGPLLCASCVELTTPSVPSTITIEVIKQLHLGLAEAGASDRRGSHCITPIEKKLSITALS